MFYIQPKRKVKKGEHDTKMTSRGNQTSKEMVPGTCKKRQQRACIEPHCTEWTLLERVTESWRRANI